VKTTKNGKSRTNCDPLEQEKLIKLAYDKHRKQTHQRINYENVHGIAQY
jgi:hypothetical protein